jgi:hypothetical protein
MRQEPLSPEVDNKTAASMLTVFVARKTRHAAATNDTVHTTNRSRCGTDGVTSGPVASKYTLISLRTPNRPVK